MANEVRAGLAISQFFKGRTEAIDDIKRTLTNAEAIGDEYTGAFIAQALSEAYTQMGDFELAKQYLDTALDYYRRNDMRPYIARVLQLLGNWYAHQGRTAEAEQAYTEARQLTEELSLPPVRLLSGSRFDSDEPQRAGPADNR